MKICLVNVSLSGSKDENGEFRTSKNGRRPYYLNAIGDVEVPENTRTIAGEVGDNLGFQVGESYAVAIKFEGNDEEYGPQYSLTNLKHLSLADLMTLNTSAPAPSRPIEEVQETEEEEVPVTTGI